MRAKYDRGVLTLVAEIMGTGYTTTIYNIKEGKPEYTDLANAMQAFLRQQREQREAFIKQLRSKREAAREKRNKLNEATHADLLKTAEQYGFGAN